MEGILYTLVQAAFVVFSPVVWATFVIVVRCLGHFCYYFSLFGPLLLLFFVVQAAFVVFSLLVLLFIVYAAFVLRFASDMVSENAAYRERCWLQLLTL